MSSWVFTFNDYWELKLPHSLTLRITYRRDSLTRIELMHVIEKPGEAPGNRFLLDEPTNHTNIPIRAAQTLATERVAKYFREINRSMTDSLNQR